MKYRAINLNTAYISIQADHKFISSDVARKFGARRLNMFYEQGARGFYLREKVCATPPVRVSVIAENFLLLPKHKTIKIASRAKFARGRLAVTL